MDRTVTIQYLKDNYPILYDLIIKEAALQNEGEVFTEGNVSHALNWSASTQGSTFWNRVYIGDFENMKKEYPELFEQKPTIVVYKDYKLVKNGLFNG